VVLASAVEVEVVGGVRVGGGGGFEVGAGVVDAAAPGLGQPWWWVAAQLLRRCRYRRQQMEGVRFDHWMPVVGYDRNLGNLSSSVALFRCCQCLRAFGAVLNGRVVSRSQICDVKTMYEAESFSEGSRGESAGTRYVLGLARRRSEMWSDRAEMEDQPRKLRQSLES
jgi:hypothetical protein